MLPLRLVLDTNVVVSAAIKPEGLSRTALLLAITRPARLYLSLPILEEYNLVLARPELRIRKGARMQLIDLIRNAGHVLKTGRRLTIAHDPEDDKFLECAESGRADYLVTGNLRHFPRFWKKTKVITPREFIGLAAPHLIE